jgi:DNA polymerase-3 subunit gamma/tau
MSLYLAHRPETFEEVIGNDEVVDYLIEALSNKKTCPHVFLLSGPTGCGKTTIARIISKELGCDPIDMKEINAANFRGIDTVREIIDSSKYFGMGGGTRVWLVDEIHKMTNDAQNAILKLLEDTPKHCYFILCTTEPEKLLPTVRGRCVDLKVKGLTDKQMLVLLQDVVKAEGKKLQKEVYEQIIQDGLGLPRTSLQILEKVLKVPAERQLEIAKASAVQVSQTIELCRALLDNSGWKKVASILTGLKNEEPETIRRQVLGYAQSVLLKGVQHDSARRMLEYFQDPLYNTGFPGLTFACYSVVFGE